MKKITPFALLLAVVMDSYSQEIKNQIIFDEKANQEILIGYCNKEVFLNDPFSEWFQPE